MNEAKLEAFTLAKLVDRFTKFSVNVYERFKSQDKRVMTLERRIEYLTEELAKSDEIASSRRELMKEAILVSIGEALSKDDIIGRLSKLEDRIEVLEKSKSRLTEEVTKLERLEEIADEALTNFANRIMELEESNIKLISRIEALEASFDHDPKRGKA